MVRSNWKGALVLTLAWASAAHGQHTVPTSPAPEQSPGRIISIGETGEQYRVLESTALPKGGVAHKIQSLTTGKVDTIFEGDGGPLPGGGAPMPMPQMSGRVVQTGVKQGAPPPPAVQGDRIEPMPASAQLAPVPEMGSGSSSDGAEYRIIQEAGRLPMKCKVLKRWVLTDGQIACQMQAVETGEILTIVETGPAQPVADAPPGAHFKEIAARIFHWGRYKTPPAGAPLPPDYSPEVIVEGPAPTFEGGVATRRGRLFRRPPAPVVVQATPAPVVVQETPRSPGLLTRIHNWFGGRSNASQNQVAQKPPQEAQPVPAAPKPVQVVQAAPKPALPAAPVAQAAPSPAVEAPRPSDWRKSWDDSPVKTAEKKPVAALERAMLEKKDPVKAKLPSPGSVPTAALPPASVTETAPKRDPLTRPEDFASRKVEQKVPSFWSEPQASALPAKAPTPPLSPAPPSPSTPLPAPTTVAAPKAPLPTPATVATPAAMVLGPGQMPLGAQSVLAANNGLERPVRYVPVPIVTVPQPKQPPLPPVPSIPQAPQPNDKFVNAFSPPPPPGGQNAAPQGYLPSSGQPMMGQQAMAPGYGQMPGQVGMVPGYPPMMGQPGMAPGYPPMAMQNRAYAPMAQRPPMPYGYPMGQAGYAPNPYYGMQQPMAAAYPYGYYGPMAQAGAMTVPAQMARGNVPYGYQGPQAPNPVVQQPVPNPYGMPNPYGVPPGGGWQMSQPRNPAMDRPAVQTGKTANQSAVNDEVLQMIAVLKTSSYPSQREWAVNNLATLDPRGNPQVVPLLLAVASQDPAPTVRSACVYGLARLRVNDPQVVAALQQLKADTDPRVRVEAEQALARLNPGQVGGAVPNAIQPVGATVPGR